MFGLAAALTLIACWPTAQRPSIAGDDNWYVLPYPTEISRKLIQGNNGPYGHSGAAAFAFDFVMPIGSPVVAARGGEVVKVEERYNDGTRVPGEENYIVIRHSDGTFGRYYHLTAHGALVDSGARVKRGDLIGRSGNSGATAGPHLHFDVTRGCFEWGCQTIPIIFGNAGTDTLVPGKMYPRPAMFTEARRLDPVLGRSGMAPSAAPYHRRG
jgi:murein DD-endopeptidase MepM/ murein hydrolase activator NlpD